MKVIVNDANILIDLVDLNILPHFFNLEFEFYTTNLILNELFESQQERLRPYIDKGSLTLDELSDMDLSEINMIQKANPMLSDKDCSAYYQAKKYNAILITSDHALRKFCVKNGLEVHGHLWVFDRMVEGETIPGGIASEKLTELCEIVNPKLGLPKAECLKRIRSWEKL